MQVCEHRGRVHSISNQFLTRGAAERECSASFFLVSLPRNSGSDNTSHAACRSGPEGGDKAKLTRLRKFIEQGAYGEKSGRIAYAFNLNSLPRPNDGMDWQTVPSFNVADELLKEPGLKDVFKVAIEMGYALVVRQG